MSNLAINDAGEVLAFDGKEWKPAPVAQNDKGERMAFNGKEWQSLAAPPSTASKIGNAVNTGVNWLGTQLTKGVNTVAGLPADLQSLGNAGAKMALESVLGPGQAKQPMTNIMPGAADLNQAVFQGLGVPEVNAGDQPALTLTDPFGIPGKVNVGKILDAGVQALPGVALGGAALPTATAGMTSEGAGQATAGTPWEIPARLAAGFGGYKVGQRLQTPLPANLTPNEARAVQIAKTEGIPLTVGQETGRGRALESALARFPTSQGRMAQFADDQATAVNRTALREGNFVGDRVDPETMKAFNRQVGSDFDNAVQNIQRVELRPNFFNDSGAAIAKYTQNTPATETLKSVSNKLDDFFDPKLMKGGAFPELDGKQFQEFRKGLSESVNDLYKNGQSGAAKALQGVRDALDDAAQASLPPAQKAAMDTARKNYAVYKIIEKAAGAGTVSSRRSGDLAPSALTQQLRRRQGDAFSRTTGGLNDTATVSQYLADTIPNSGTPATLGMQSMFAGGPVGAGFALGGAPGAGIGALIAAAPNMAARAMTGTGGGGLLRRYLANQSQAANLGLLDARSVPFALFPAAPGLPRLESRQ